MLQEVGNVGSERKVMAILRVLSESSEPLGSITIARELERYGIFLSERAIRYHLRITDERGYTQPLGRDGRLLTTYGLEELKMALAPQQVGFILQKLELLAFYTTFDPVKKTGHLPINTTLIERGSYKKALEIMSGAFKGGICVSNLVITAGEGEKMGNILIPPGKIGFGTVCSAVINGVLLKAGVPIESKFGGVLEIKDGKPRRFVAIIDYAGTSLDPSEQYIRAGMTSVNSVVQKGSGKLLANFREIPSPCRKIAAEKVSQLKEAGIGGVYALGNTSEAVCQITVGLNRVGMVLLGGLSPVATVVEAGLDVENVAESGLVEFAQLKTFQQVMDEA